MRTTIIATADPESFRGMLAASGIGLAAFAPVVSAACRAAGETRPAPRLRVVHGSGQKAAA